MTEINITYNAVKELVENKLVRKTDICKKYPSAHIMHTMKHDPKRHHYYIVEDGAPMKYLSELRGVVIPKDKRKGV